MKIFSMLRRTRPAVDRRWSRLVFMTSATMLCAGCADEVCTSNVVYSIHAFITDPAGDGVEGASVRFTHERGTMQPCEEVGDGEYSCGEDLAGNMTVWVDAEGFESTSQGQKVLGGLCHVQTQTLDFELQPVGWAPLPDE